MGLFQANAEDGTGSASEVDLLSVVLTHETTIKDFGITQRAGAANGTYRLKVNGTQVDDIFAAAEATIEKSKPGGIVRAPAGATVSVTMEQGTIGACSATLNGNTKGADQQDI